MTETGPITFSLDGQKPLYHLLGTATRYSGWTARVTTTLEYFKIPYTATYIKMSTVKNFSKSGLIPLLTPLTLSPQIQINDSLSILEFLAESHPSLPLWPKNSILRALARSAVAEMHSGFSELRGKYHSTFVGKYEGDVPVSEKARKEVERLLVIWDGAREVTKRILGDKEGKDGGWLFGEFGIADIYFWPVLWRLRSYNLPLDTATPEALEWMSKMWSEPTLKALGNDYFKQVENPDTLLPQYDDIFKGNEDVKYGHFHEGWVFEGVEEGVRKL